MLYLRAMFLLLLLTKVSISAEAEKQKAVALEAWKKLDRTVLKSGEIDSLIEKELVRLGITPAPLCSDYDYIRRISLDLTGKPPSPLEIRLFLSDKTLDKQISARNMQKN